MLSGEAASYTVFGLTQPGLKFMITQDGHANHYTTDLSLV